METTSKARIWGGRAMSGIAVLFLVMDGLMKVMHAIPFEPGDELLLGFDPSAMPMIGALLLACTAIYVAPRVSLLGAILLTGYLGGAVASHVRVDNPLFTHTLFPTYAAALIWGGLLLRHPGLSLLLPAREKRAAAAPDAPPTLAHARR